MSDSTLVFVHDDRPEVVVNFGVHAGREATQAEIERLGAALQADVPSFAVVAERRYGFGQEGGAAVHQVRVELPDGDPARIAPAVEAWASDCIAERRLV
jgi:hypothetical protein